MIYYSCMRLLKNDHPETIAAAVFQPPIFLQHTQPAKYTCIDDFFMQQITGNKTCN